MGKGSRDSSELLNRLKLLAPTLPTRIAGID
jgi:hypothetical protein